MESVALRGLKKSFNVPMTLVACSLRAAVDCIKMDRLGLGVRRSLRSVWSSAPDRKPRELCCIVAKNFGQQRAWRGYDTSLVPLHLGHRVQPKKLAPDL